MIVPQPLIHFVMNFLLIAEDVNQTLNALVNIHLLRIVTPIQEFVWAVYLTTIGMIQS